MTRPSAHPKGLCTCEDCGAQFLAGLHPPARWCSDCRWRHRGRKPLKYRWTPERDALLRARYDSRVRGRSQAIATSLGWPAWQVKRRACLLGLAHPWPSGRKPWTAEELTFLETHAGTRHVHWIAKRLQRSLTSVVVKLKRLHISQAVTDGYRLRDLELCFGTDHHVIERWVREGKLTIRRGGTKRAGKQGDFWHVTDLDLRRFVAAHPTAFRLDKVDQVWFLDLVFGRRFGASAGECAA